MKSFASYHPVSLLIYFVLILTITMFINIPVLLIISFGGAWLYNLLYDRLRYNVLFDVMLFLIIAVANPIFSHRGRTALFFVNGKPITLEAVIYGICMAIMMLGVIHWCKAFTRIMTSDKLLYLCGKLTPNLSVVLSMAMRYIPLFRIQTAKVGSSQTAMGLYQEEGYLVKAKGSMRIFSIVLTWSLENAIDTANSMRARGYGLGKRSRYSIFSFTPADIILIIISSILAAIIITGCALGEVTFDYYPGLSAISTSPVSLVVYLACALLAFLPVLIEGKEKIRWQLYRSRM